MRRSLFAALLALAALSASCEADVPAEGTLQPVVALTPAEVVRSSAALVGVEVPDGVAPWQDLPDTQGHVDQAALSAARFAAELHRSDRFWLCAADAVDATCLRESTHRFAREAFRRPVDEGELAWLDELLDPADPDASARRAVEAVLLAPQFLLRFETVGGADLDPWSLAARLSFLLWGRHPDALLLAAAGNGSLLEPGGVEAQVRRMLAEPRARGALGDLHRRWLGIESQERTLSPGISFPDADDEGDARTKQAAALAAQRPAFDLFVRDGVVDGGSLADLLLREDRWVSDWTVELYGLTTPSALPDELVEDPGVVVPPFAGLQLWRATPEDRRAGLLTLLEPLNHDSHPDQASSVQRGARTLRRVLCDPIPAPPPDVMTVLTEPPQGTTRREHIESITAAEGCSDCHSAFGGVGFSFEHYDGIGRWTAEDAGVPVDASGEVWLDGAVRSFDDAIGLSTLLAGSEQVHRCYARHWAAELLGRAPTPEEEAELEGPLRAALAGGSLEDFIVGIATSAVALTPRDAP